MNTLLIYIRFYIKYFLYWLSVFTLFRLLFIIVYFYKVKDSSITEILFSISKGVRLDISVISYLTAFPMILFVLYQLLEKDIFLKFKKIFTISITILVITISVSEILLYSEWGTKLNYKAISHLTQPSEVFRTATWFQTIFFFMTLIVMYFIFNKQYTYFYKRFNYEQLVRPKYLHFGSFIVLSILTVIGLRGGLQQIPINQSDCYYSGNHTLNLIAINPSWNLIHSITENYSYGNSNPYELYNSNEVSANKDYLHKTSKDSTIKFITKNNPNVVLIILEGWSADMVKSCGGDEGFTPQLENIAEGGVMFTNIYASGSRSDQGMACILSGFPAQPKTSIIAQANKYPKLPCIVNEFKNKKYYTSYYFGGQLSYGNIKGYLVFNKFDKIKEIYDFDASIPQGKLGIHDEFVYNEQLKELNTHPQPFFSAIFTASTHSPYDMPIKKWTDYNSNESGYMNSVRYADSCLGVYFNEAKKQKWYSNTLFVIIPDHSHNSHKNHEFDAPEYRKIPMLFCGDVIDQKYRGYKMSKLGSQIDVVSTLLNQLNITADKYTWSKNLMNPTTKSFAYYACNEGFGWISEKDTFNYYYDINKTYRDKIHSSNKDSVVKTAQSYLQSMFQNYLDY